MPLITSLRFPRSPLRLLHIKTALSRQYVTTQTPASRPIASPTSRSIYPPIALPFIAKEIEETLQNFKLDKWGWVIYRTSYKNEAAWDRFRHDITWWSREELEAFPMSPFVRGAIEWTFVSDPALEGASHDELRRRFREWRARAYYTETRRGLPQTWDGVTQRYLYFVEVDEAALDSVVQASVPGGGPAVVNFLECDTNVTLPLDAPPKLDKWGCGDDYKVWPMMAKSITDVIFWRTIFRWVNDPCLGPSIHESMEEQMEAIEKERERMVKAPEGVFRLYSLYQE